MKVDNQLKQTMNTKQVYKTSCYKTTLSRLPLRIDLFRPNPTRILKTKQMAWGDVIIEITS